jgi:hypothetical protein
MGDGLVLGHGPLKAVHRPKSSSFVVRFGVRCDWPPIRAELVPN